MLDSTDNDPKLLLETDFFVYTFVLQETYVD